MDTAPRIVSVGPPGGVEVDSATRPLATPGCAWGCISAPQKKRPPAATAKGTPIRSYQSHWGTQLNLPLDPEDWETIWQVMMKSSTNVLKLENMHHVISHKHTACLDAWQPRMCVKEHHIFGWGRLRVQV